MRIPLEGIRIEDFDRLLDIASNGARVFRTTGSGFCTIPLAVNNVPHDCERKGGPPSAPHGGVTAVLDVSEALSHNARVIKALSDKYKQFIPEMVTAASVLASSCVSVSLLPESSLPFIPPSRSCKEEETDEDEEEDE